MSTSDSALKAKVQGKPSRKVIERCPTCAKQNKVGRLRRFQIHWNDHVTLCDNEECLYPLIPDEMVHQVPSTNDVNVTEESMPSCSSWTSETISQQPCASVSLQTDEPDFLQALDIFLSENVLDVTAEQANPIDLFLTSDVGTDGAGVDELDNLIAILNIVPTSSTLPVVQEPQTPRLELDACHDHSTAWTILDQNSRVVPPDPPSRVPPTSVTLDPVTRVPPTSRAQDPLTRVPPKPVTPDPETKVSPKSVTRQPPQCKVNSKRTSSTVTKKAATKVLTSRPATAAKSMEPRKRSSPANRQQFVSNDLNFMDLFSNGSKRRRSSCSRGGQQKASKCTEDDINKNNMVSSWLSGAPTGVCRSRKKFAGYHSSVSSMRIVAGKDDGTPSEDSGIQSPGSLPSADSESMGMR